MDELFQLGVLQQVVGFDGVAADDYSGGATAKADLETPILRELSIIANRGSCGDAILIDVARLFGWRNDCPRLAKSRQFVKKHWPDYKIEVELDLIRIAPQSKTPI